MEENSKIKKKLKKKLQNNENSDKEKKFFLSKAFDFTNREQNTYLSANLSKKDQKRTMKSAKL
jgi:hypothetical protein